MSRNIYENNVACFLFGFEHATLFCVERFPKEFIKVSHSSGLRHCHGSHHCHDNHKKNIRKTL